MTAVSLEHSTVPADTGEVTLLIARRVDPGYEADFELWAKGILESAASFAGHLGYGLFRSSGGDAPLAIYPISVLGGLFLMPHLTALPLLLNSLITAAVFNVLMTYAAMPAVSRLLRGWLTT
ncbi:hypothetical protein [Streptomyces sp. NPDC059761]|uniref:hypothetical protein n=1 Tax=Streptomyces sp. NPDC059761 TaxID=3346937 RepID=UPI0036638966